MRRSLRRAFLLGVVAGIVVALVRRALRPPHPPSGAPELDRATPALAPSSAVAPPRVEAEPATTPHPVAGACLAPAPTSDPRLGGQDDASPPDLPTETTSMPTGPTGPTIDAGAPAAHEPNAGGRTTDGADDGAPAWAAPVEGVCPDGYPVKAKEASGIFHVPGGLSYERTRPDRCYPTAEAAEADGFRPAKR